jgi:RNA polymerase subunit RPABC4/transcription elongation factor Spt4
MQYCRSCKYLSPTGAIYCGSCGRSFGGRRCPQNHLSPQDSQVCIQCGTIELSETTDSIAPLGLIRVIGLGIIGLTLLLVAPYLLRQGRLYATALWHHFFNVVAIDKVLAFIIVVLVILHLLPGGFGRSVRRNWVVSLGKAIQGFFYFLGNLSRLATAILYFKGRKM